MTHTTMPADLVVATTLHAMASKAAALPAPVIDEILSNPARLGECLQRDMLLGIVNHATPAELAHIAAAAGCPPAADLVARLRAVLDAKRQATPVAGKAAAP